MMLRFTALPIVCALALLVTPSALAQSQADTKDDAPPKQLGFTQNQMGAICVMHDEPGHPVQVKDSHGRYQTITGFCPSFTATDGQIVQTAQMQLINPSYVAVYLERTLRDARVISREMRQDANGKIIGQRIVAMRDVPTEPHKRGPNDPHKAQGMILWIDGTYAAEILCDSLDDALAFEQAYQWQLHSHR